MKVRYANGTVSGYIKYHRLSIGSRQTWERAKRAHELKLLQERWPQNSFCSFPVNGGGRDYGRTTMRPDGDGEVKVKRVSNETTGYINAKTLSAASRSTWAVAVREFWEVNTCVQVGSDTMKLLTAPDANLQVTAAWADTRTSGAFSYDRLKVGKASDWEAGVRAHERAEELKRLRALWPKQTFCSYSAHGGGGGTRVLGKTSNRVRDNKTVKVMGVNNVENSSINVATLTKVTESAWKSAIQSYWKVGTIVKVGNDTMKLLTAPDASVQVTAAWADTRTSGAFSYDRLKVGKASDWEAGVRAHERAEELKRLRALWPVGSYCSAEKGSVLGLTTTLPSETHSITFRLVGYEDKQKKLPLTKLNKVSKAEWEDANRKFWCAGKIVQSSNGIMKLVTCPNADMAVTATR